MRGIRPQRKCLFLPAAESFNDLVWRPAADIYRTHNGWLAKFDLAGINPQEIHVNVCGRRLSVQGARRDLLIEEGCCYHALEIAYSPFERHLEFPVDLERATIDTEYQAGMLLVRIGLPEEKP
jgi:HSP20 family protein